MDGSNVIQRGKVWGVLIMSMVALMASSPTGQSYDVFSSFPGPVFTLSRVRPSIAYVLSVETVPASLPDDQQWEEFFEVEIDFRTVQEGTGGSSQRVVGELVQLHLDSGDVVSSTTTEIRLAESQTMFLIDEEGRMECRGSQCRRIYIARFSLSGEGSMRAQWFIRAGIAWENANPPPPEEAQIVYGIRRL